MNSINSTPRSEETRRIFLIDSVINQFRWVGRRTDADGAALVKVRYAPVAAGWHPIGIDWVPETRFRSACDFPVFHPIIRCFSRRALEIVSAHIEGGLEILPLNGLDNKYVGMHCIHWLEGAANLEGIDQAKTSIHSINFVPRINAKRIGNDDVFGVPEMIAKLFVSERFKNAVNQHGLVGLEFREVELVQ